MTGIQVLNNNSISDLGSPSFDKERCYGRNCKLVLKWYPLECQIDSYILETKIHGKEDAFRNVYNGKECSYVLAGVKYGVKVTARVRAKNRAGTGTESDEILLEMPEGNDTPQIVIFYHASFKWLVNCG